MELSERDKQYLMPNGIINQRMAYQTSHRNGWSTNVWRVGGLGKIGRLSAIENETVREKIKADEKSQDFS